MDETTDKKQVDINDKLLEELKGLRTDFNDKLTGEKLGRRFLLGIVGGFGTVVGATILVSIAIFLLNQFATIDIIKPIVDRVIDVIDTRNNS